MVDANYQPTERRPIKARQWWVFERMAYLLAASGVSANAISLAGMGCGMMAGVLLAITDRAHECQRAAWLAAAVFIQLRLLANLLDGMVAIEAGQASRVGELYNEVPDRVSDTATIVGAGYAAGGDIVLGFAAACVAVFTAYIRATGKAAGAPQQYCGPMAKPQRMALLTAVSLYCGIAPASWQFPSGNSGFGMVTISLWLIVIGGLITSIRRLARIAAHLKGATA